MRNHIDEQYADNPAEAQAREAHYESLRILARMIHADMADRPFNIGSIYQALNANLSSIEHAARCYRELLAAKAPEKPQEEPNV